VAQDEGKQLVVVWIMGEECPARFAELFDPLDGVIFVDSDDLDLAAKLLCMGAPTSTTVKRDIFTHPAIAASPEREVAMFSKLQPRAHLERAVNEMLLRCGGARSFVAVHVRRTDFVSNWGVSTPDDEFFRFADVHAGATDAVFVATDNAETQHAFAEHCGAQRVRTLAGIDACSRALRHTSVAHAVVDMFTCASSRVFKGTRGSSFSEAIWLLRRSRGFAHEDDELHTSRQLRRRRWRERQQQKRRMGQRGEEALQVDPTSAPETTERHRDVQHAVGLGDVVAVVVHHSSCSFEELIASLGCAGTIIYDKSDMGLPPASALLRQHLCDVHRVPNVGRESEAYLRFIVERYDSLPVYTLFMQDDTHVHVPPHHHAHFIQQVASCVRCGEPGRVLQVAHRGRKLYPPVHMDSTNKLYPRLADACRRFGLSLPAAYDTHVCAFVLCSSSAIRQHPRELYERLLAWHSDCKSVRNRRGASEAELAPWLLEHLWEVILFRQGGAKEDDVLVSSAGSLE
jgi:hypothetical protein